MYKKVLKATGIAVAVVIVISVTVILNMIFGNPVSKLLATHSAEKYLEENFGDSDFMVDGVYYDFKEEAYIATVKSDTSIDSHFHITLDSFGNIYGDEYDEHVLSGWNTRLRLDNEYDGVVAKVIEGDKSTYDLDFAVAKIETTSEEHANSIYTPVYAIPDDEFEVDGSYDINELGKRAGRISVYIYDENLTPERMAEVLLHIKKLLDEEGIGFRAIDCMLKYPKDENGEFVKSDYIAVTDFPYSEIYEDGMSERVGYVAEILS